MRLLLNLLGFTLDVCLDRDDSTPLEVPTEEPPMHFYGAVESYPVGFVPQLPTQLEGNPDRWEPLYDD